MIAAGRSMLAAVGTDQRTTTVTPLEPEVIENPNFPGQTTISWDNPTEGTPVAGLIQPVRAETAVRLSITSLSRTWEVHTDPLDIQPEGRVRIASTDYEVLEARHWVSHSELVVSEL